MQFDTVNAGHMRHYSGNSNPLKNPLIGQFGEKQNLKQQHPQMGRPSLFPVVGVVAANVKAPSMANPLLQKNENSI
jgi:hypothetical protein